MKPEKYDFSGWATRNDIRCADGRTIKRDAFKECDGRWVPLVWGHDYIDIDNILGKALLENRPEGVYCYGVFNDTEAANKMRPRVMHGDINSLSIYANHLQQDEAKNVMHGSIKEVSLVLAGANPGAFIDYSLAHSDEESDSVAAVIFNPIELLDIVEHSDDQEELVHEDKKEDKEMPKDEEKTVQDVIDSMNEEQQQVLYALVAEAANQNNNEEGDDMPEMKHNLFDNETETEDTVLSHADIEAIFSDAKRAGDLKETCLQHGVTNIGYLYEDHKNLNPEPAFISRKMDWVAKVMNGVHHTPFSRIKSMFADVTADAARAKGYFTKGSQKIEEVISLLKRTTDPTTVYKLQKFDRDDVLDITDFNVVAWIKKEMRMMLDEEIARAILVGDGRLATADDKIAPDKIRPIWTDADLFTVKASYAYADNDTDAAKVKKFIQTCIRSRKLYKGSGTPTLFTTEDVLTDCLLLEDTTGRIIYETPEKLATALRVAEIVTVPVMEGLFRDTNTNRMYLQGIIVNMGDYNVGADKGGEVNLFDDFNINFNKYEYLIETRISGALVKPYSAVAVELQGALPEDSEG